MGTQIPRSKEHDMWRGIAIDVILEPVGLVTSQLASTIDVPHVQVRLSLCLFVVSRFSCLDSGFTRLFGKGGFLPRRSSAPENKSTIKRRSGDTTTHTHRHRFHRYSQRRTSHSLESRSVLLSVAVGHRSTRPMAFREDDDGGL